MVMKLAALTDAAPAARDVCRIEFYFENGSPKSIRDFSGKSGERLLIHGHSDVRRMVVGLGKKSKFETDVLRKAAAEAAVDMAGRGIRTAALDLSVGDCTDTASALIIAESVRLSQYRFSMTSDPPEQKHLDAFFVLCHSASQRKQLTADLTAIAAIADSVDLARDIANQPGNVGFPAAVVRTARKLSGAGIRVRVLDRRACEKLGMGAFLSVARGSHQPPAFLVMEYRPGRTTRKPIVVVGKGITFDSGGISIKPSEKMDEMKNDKAGAAAVIGIMAAARKLRPRLPIVALAPLTENLPGGNATRPGDVIRSLSGKTIEIKNTDAEGRLILADALYYAGRFNPEAIIDFATLTGACSIALGDVYAAILSNNDALSHSLIDAGESCGERLWRLPLHSGYERLIHSSVADMHNIGEGRLAGTIVGGIFLKRFLPKDNIPWAHIDIAATAWDTKGRGGMPAGSTGIGVRLFYEFLKLRGDIG